MHRFTTNKGVELIKKFEGFKAKPYYCASGYLTIGYGHKIELNKLQHTNYEWSKELAHEMLIYDLLKVERAILRYINVALSDNQFDSLASFTFNLGPAALQRSTLRHKINCKMYDEAANEFLRWIYVKGTIKSNGLIRRRKVERQLFLEG